MMEKYLHKLGTMLKKRKRKSFEQELRAKLMQKAETLNEAPKSRFVWPQLNWSFMKGFTPAMAAVLLVVLVLQFVLPGVGVNLPGLVNVVEAKDYYTLTPQLEDESGIAADSTFVLSSKGSLNAGDVEKVLSVEPVVELEVEQVSNNEVLITPAEELEVGGIYAFELDAQDLPNSPYPKEYNWAYEVSDAFRVTGTLPGDQKSGIPTNTGIEVNFTHIGVGEEDFKNAFSIEPAVSGTFKVNGKTGVFAPSGGLREATQYTVRLSGGLLLADTDQSLGEDYVFTFESSSATRATTSIAFNQSIFDFSSSESPSFPVQFYEDGVDEENPTVALSIYEFGNDEDFLNALQDQDRGAPAWTYYQRKNYRVDTTGLSKVHETVEYELINDQGHRLQLPGTLNEGAYVLELQKNDAVAQTFLQVSNTAAYINLNGENSLVWVNDVASGEPVKGATINFIDTELDEKTNSDGVANFENIFEEIQVNKLKQNTAFLSLQNGDQTTYYRASFYGYPDSVNEDHWQLLKTDRETYLPTDKVFFWGFVQGREAPLKGDATLYLYDGYFSEYSSSFSDLKAGNHVLDQQVLSLSDGEAYEGHFDLNKLLPNWSYSILLVQDEQLISSTNFSVQNYVKPAYQIVLDADKTALFEGEETSIDITARFFEGTPVANTDLRVNYPDGETEIVKTNELGQAQVTWTADLARKCEGSRYCYAYDGRNLTVTPLQEELADIQGAVYFQVFRSKSILDTTDQVVDADEFKFKVVEVDLAAEDYKSITPDLNASIELNVTQIEYVEQETGEVYDDENKVVKTAYRTVEVERLYDTETLTPNEAGEFFYDSELPEGFRYEVTVKINDGEGGYYVHMEYPNYLNGNRSYLGSNYLGLLVNGESNADPKKIGDSVNVSVDGVTDGSTLFMLEQSGVQRYAVKNDVQYDFTFGEEHVPNVFVAAIHFDGQHYIQTSGKNIILDTEDRRLTVDLSMDQAEYEPGEEVTLTVKTDEASQVNLYLVDEAYYALFAESFRDPLQLLYQYLGAGIDYSYLSHVDMVPGGDGGQGGCFVAGTQILMFDGTYKSIEDIEVGDFILTRSSEWNGKLVSKRVMNTTEVGVGEYLLVNGNLGVTEEHVLFINGQWQLAGELKVGDLLLNKDGKNVLVENIERVKENVMVYNFEVEDKHTYFADDIYVHNDKGGAREDFRDTALFTVVDTDENGEATVTFTLPDNITSWRVSAAAVSGGKEIKAGYGSAELSVTKDLFVNPVINSSYLTGDQPSIPLRAYGDSLSSGEAVNFSMDVESLNSSQTAEGTAFGTTYFALPALTEGEHRIVSTVGAEGLSDSVALSTDVVNSHLVTPVVSEEVLSENSTLSGSKTERSTVSFINNEVADIYGALLGTAYQNGDRADAALARTVSLELLNSHFEKTYNIQEFPAFVYQETDAVKKDLTGGIALLPYSDVELELSALLAALGHEHFNSASLRTYFEGILNNPDKTLSEKILALYGLAGMGETYLNELNYFVEHFELNADDKLYAALAYTTYGDEASATDLFIEIVDAKPVNMNEAAWLALMATLADQLDSDQRDALWAEALKAKDQNLIIAQKTLYVKSRLERGAQSKVSFKLNDEKITLKDWEVYEKTYLPEELEDLKFSDFDGEILATVHYEEPLDLATFSPNNNIRVSRSYRVDGQTVTTLAPGQIVEVHLSLVVPANLANSSFKVTDYMPSGLQSATGMDSVTRILNTEQYRHPYNQDEQAVSFYVSCYRGVCKNSSFFYLARVINKGSFVSEPAVAQNYQDGGLMNVSGERATLLIE